MGEHFQRLTAAAEDTNIPLSVSLELTGRCPLRCAHCYVAHDTAELPTRDWLALVDELAALGTMFVAVTGGEPFLRNDVLDIVERARHQGMAVTLLTSGTAPIDFARVARLHPLVVGLSMYSTDPGVHDAITGTPGSHDRALHAATELRQRDVRVRLAAPILAANVSAVTGISALADRIGADVVFDPMTIIGRDGDQRPAHLRPTAEVLARALHSLGDDFQSGARANPEPMCAAGRRVATVLPNGDVLPCSLYPESAGNVSRERFADIWQSSPVLHQLRKLTVGNLEPACATCSKHSYCGRCGALALLEDGALLGPSRAACMLAEARDIARPSHRHNSRVTVRACKE